MRIVIVCYAVCDVINFEITLDLLLTLSWRRPLPYRNQSIDLWSKSMDCFLYDNGLHHERVKLFSYMTKKSAQKFLKNERNF